MILLVALFFWIHYFFSSITSHAAAVLPVVLAVGSGIPGLPVTTLAMLCMYSLGLMGVISPYATGPAPMYFGSGYIGKGQFWGFGLLFGLLYFGGTAADRAALVADGQVSGPEAHTPGRRIFFAGVGLGKLRPTPRKYLKLQGRPEKAMVRAAVQRVPPEPLAAISLSVA